MQVILICALAVVSIAGSLPDEKPAAKWKTNIAVSYVNSSGNTDASTLAGKLGLSRSGGNNGLFVKMSALSSTTEEKETANRFNSEARWETKFTKNVFFFFNANYIRNKFSGYNYRVSGGPGIGYDLFEAGDQELKGYTSVVYHHDEYYRGEAESDKYTALRAALTYSWKAAHNLVLSNSSDYHLSFKERNKYFANSEVAVKVLINSHFSVGVTYSMSYQNYLPSTNLERLDTMLLTSLSFDF